MELGGEKKCTWKNGKLKPKIKKLSIEIENISKLKAQMMMMMYLDWICNSPISKTTTLNIRLEKQILQLSIQKIRPTKKSNQTSHILS